MFKKILSLFKFNIKYELKRNIPLFIILSIFLLFSFGLKNPISGLTHSINIIDKDNTLLSAELTEFLIKQKNLIQTPTATTTLIIPYGFMEDYKNSNATIKMPALSALVSADMCYFQLYHINESNKIKTYTQNLYDSELTILVMLSIFLIAFTTQFIGSRANGSIYFMSNHIGFWVYWVMSNMVSIIFIISFIVTGMITIKQLMLFGILFLIWIVVIYKLRRNALIIENQWYAMAILFGTLLILKTKNFYYLPIADLLFSKTHPIIIVDIIIFVVLLIIVSKIRLTER